MKTIRGDVNLLVAGLLLGAAFGKSVAGGTFEPLLLGLGLLNLFWFRMARS